MAKATFNQQKSEFTKNGHQRCQNRACHTLKTKHTTPAHKAIHNTTGNMYTYIYKEIPSNKVEFQLQNKSGNIGN